MLTTAHAMILLPEYDEAKAGSLRIIELIQKSSQINPQDESGIILVCLSKRMNLFWERSKSVLVRLE